MAVRKLAGRLALARELARILRLLRGAGWEEAYYDLVVQYRELPSLEELRYADAYGCDVDQLDAFDEEDDGAPFPEERF